MPSGPRGSELTAAVTSTATVKTLTVVQTTFDTYSDPCNYLLTQLAERIRSEASLPSSATLECSLVSYSTMADARRQYRWSVTASWTVSS